MQIVAMNDENLYKVHAIEKLCFDDPWSVSTFKLQLLTDYAHYIVAYADNDVVGYAGMWRFGDEGEILNFAVHPDFRGRGIGDAMMEVYKGMCTKLTLDVRKGNIPARRLYEKHGFIEKGIRKDYYKNPTEDAIIMWLEVNHEKT